MKEAQLGNTLTEYGLIGTMIALASIVGLSLLGKDLNLQFGQVAAGAPSTMSLLGAPVKATPGTTTNSTGSIPGSSGTTFNNSRLPTNATYQALAASVQTAGANGTTTMLADSLVALAKQQLANGTITQNQYNQLINLANQGYTIAHMEGLVENAGNNSSISNADFYNINLPVSDNIASAFYFAPTVPVDQRTTNIVSLSVRIGFDHGTTGSTLLPDPLSYNSGSSGIGATLNGFLTTYQDITSSNQLAPSLSTQLQALASEIITVSDTVSLSAQARGTGSLASSDFTSDMANRLSAYSPSWTTSQDSGQICTMGSGQSTGSSCAP